MSKVSNHSSVDFRMFQKLILLTVLTLVGNSEDCFKKRPSYSFPRVVGNDSSSTWLSCIAIASNKIYVGGGSLIWNAPILMRYDIESGEIDWHTIVVSGTLAEV